MGTAVVLKWLLVSKFRWMRPWLLFTLHAWWAHQYTHHYVFSLFTHPVLFALAQLSLRRLQ